MITRAKAAQMLDEFEREVDRVGYEHADKRALTNIFGYLERRCSDPTLYSSTQKMKAITALEQRWHQDRIGSPILADRGEVMGWDPSGTDRGAKTIGSILRQLRSFLVELPEKIDPPKPQFFPPIFTGGVPTEAIDAAVSKALAARDTQKEAALV